MGREGFLCRMVSYTGGTFGFRVLDNRKRSCATKWRIGQRRGQGSKCDTQCKEHG